MSNYGINNLYPKPSITATGTAAPMQQLTIAASAIQFATAFDQSCSMVAVDIAQSGTSPGTGVAYVTFDGSVPSSTNGFNLYTGDKLIWSKATATAAKFIRSGASSCIANAGQFSI